MKYEDNSDVVTINNWKDLKKKAPSAGYLYIDCKQESKPENQGRKVTVSKNWVLITEPEEQAIISVNDYAIILQKF